MCIEWSRFSTVAEERTRKELPLSVSMVDEGPQVNAGMDCDLFSGSDVANLRRK